MSVSITTKTSEKPGTVGGFKAKPKASKRRKLFTWMGTILGVLLLTTAAWAFWPMKTPPPTADAGTLAKFMASPKFAKMTTDEQKPYLEAVRKDPREFFDASRKVLSDDERRSAMQNMFMKRYEEQIDGYFKLTSKQEKDKYLDKQIDEQLQREKEWAARRAANGGQNGQGGGNWQGRGGGGRGLTATGLKNRMERTPPEMAAKHSEYRAALQKRREERGIPAPTWPGGGGR